MKDVCVSRLRAHLRPGRERDWLNAGRSQSSGRGDRERRTNGVHARENSSAHYLRAMTCVTIRRAGSTFDEIARFQEVRRGASFTRCSAVPCRVVGWMISA